MKIDKRLISNILLVVVGFLLHIILGTLTLILVIYLEKNYHKINKKNYSERVAYHEAGHAIMGKAFNINPVTVSIVKKAAMSGQTVFQNSYHTTPTQLKKLVFIRYAGYLSEKEFLKEASNGCMGRKTADIERATNLMKQYIRLTDDNFSITGLDSGLDEKVVEISKKWLKEAEVIIKENREDIEELKEELMDKGIINYNKPTNSLLKKFNT